MSQPQNQIVIYQPDETLRIDVRLENDTVWLTQARMGELFGVDRSVINRHIRNIYATAELLEGATCAKIAQVQKEGGRMVSRIQPYYNLDVIIAVGYRVNSPQATHFRIWATGVLKEVLLRGYAVNERIDRLERRVAKTEEQIPFPLPALLPLPLRPWRTLREPFFRPPSAMALQDAAPPRKWSPWLVRDYRKHWHFRLFSAFLTPRGRAARAPTA